MMERIFGHFTFLKFTESYWQNSESERVKLQEMFLHGLQSLGAKTFLYQIFPLSTECDVLLWSSLKTGEKDLGADFLADFTRFLNSQRLMLIPVRTWWGFTRPSDYARGKSAQEIDPFDGERGKYLTIYPFTKTTNWYQLNRDTRQGMMNEHIRTGRQYPLIKQLLLYSTGLQDQEFIVVYEMDDLTEFSSLVSDLRDSDARRYTLLDTPIFTATYHIPRETLALFK